MSKELPILHDKVRVGGRIIEIPMNYGRQDARIRQRMASDRYSGRRLAVGVFRRQEARKTGVCLAPSGMLQVVAATVRMSVGKLGVTDDHLVLLATANRESGAACM